MVNILSFTKLNFVEHLLRRSTKMVNVASRSTILVNLDLVDLDFFANFLKSKVVFGESEAGGAVPNRCIISI